MTFLDEGSLAEGDGQEVAQFTMRPIPPEGVDCLHTLDLQKVPSQYCHNTETKFNSCSMATFRGS